MRQEILAPSIVSAEMLFAALSHVKLVTIILLSFRFSIAKLIRFARSEKQLSKAKIMTRDIEELDRVRGGGGVLVPSQKKTNRES